MQYSITLYKKQSKAEWVTNQSPTSWVYAFSEKVYIEERIFGFSLYHTQMDPNHNTTTTTTTPPKALEANEQQKDNAEKAEEEYTVFSKPRRMFIAAIVSFAGLLSPFSSTVYYPALTEINKVCP